MKPIDLKIRKGEAVVIQHIIREEGICLDDSSMTFKEGIRHAIDELPDWKFADRHRRGLFERVSDASKEAVRIGRGVVAMAVNYSGVRLPVLSISVNKVGLRMEENSPDVFVLVIAVLPEFGGNEEIKTRILGALRTMFRERFLQERMKIADSRYEIAKLLSEDSAESQLLAG